MNLIDKDALVAEIEKLQSEIAEEKKLHEDNSMWYNGINHGFNLTKDILNTLEVKEVQEEPVSIDFEQELYKAFGQVKDFTLGMRIAKWFYDMGKNSQEHVSEDLGEYINELFKQFPEVSFAKLSRIAVRVAKWQITKLMKDATKVTVHIDAGGYPYTPEIELYDYDKDVPLAKEGDKYKVVLIKEE